MATNREEAQQQRMAERLRGAQRIYLADESFDLGIDIDGGPDEAAPPPPPPAPEPQSSSPSRKRKRGGEARPPSSSPRGRASGEGRRRGQSSQDVYDLPDTSKEALGQSHPESAAREPAAEPEPEPEPEAPQPEPQSPEVAPPQSLAAQVLSSGGRDPGLPPQQVTEEIEESPANAPGSGRRRRVAGSSALASSARLHDALSSDGPLSSSPLVKKSRRRLSEVSKPRSSLQQSIPASDDEPAVEPSGSEGTEEEEEEEEEEGEAEDEEEIEPVAEPEETTVSEEAEPEEEAEEEQEEQDEEAEEISAAEAAKTLGKGKRGRPSPRAPSVELGEGEEEGDEGSNEEAQEEEEEEEEQQPPPKRRRGIRSPAVQKQGGPKAKKVAPTARRKSSSPSIISNNETDIEPEPVSSKPQPRATTTTKPPPTKPGPKPQRGRKRKSPDSPAEQPKQSRKGGGRAIDIAVQRFVNHKRRQTEGEGGGEGGDREQVDELQLDIPYANYGRETVVDVLAQVCDEVIGVTQGQLEQLLDQAPDAAKKKEYKLKMRAIEAYRHELNTRLLEHAIYLNHWHSLRKRVREAQKEKLALREDILRIRAEREQVAIRMDAIRARHDEDQTETTFLLNTSSTMRDIDRVIEAGREAPELPQKARREAELANLELAVRQVSEQASSAGPGGGLLSQIKDFNAFLERTARALESK